MKIHKFSGKGHSPSSDLTPLAAYGVSILSSSALDLRLPNVPVALTPMLNSSQKRNFDDDKMHLVTVQGVLLQTFMRSVQNVW